MIAAARPRVTVRTTREEDFEGIIALCRKVYPDSAPWRTDQLRSHLDLFPEGQFVAVEEATHRILGMAASLVILWDDYNLDHNWHDFTDHGKFTNHDPENGHTLYGAEIMVDPESQRRGIGKKIYRARTELAQGKGLLRIRAGARLRGYGRHAARMSAEEYVIRVIQGRLKDPTLSFQLREGFDVIDVVSGYLQKDPASQGWAAVIEWLNPAVARPEDSAHRDPKFRRPDPPPDGATPVDSSRPGNAPRPTPRER